MIRNLWRAVVRASRNSSAKRARWVKLPYCSPKISLILMRNYMSGYIEPVKFSVTGTYGCSPEGDSPEGEDDVYTVEEFNDMCESGGFIDYDGYGHPVKDSMANPSIWVKPSKRHLIPSDATHIVWYNR